MKNVFLVAGLGVIAYAWYRQNHRAGGGTDISTANNSGTTSYSGGIDSTSGGGTQGLAGSSGGPLGVLPNMHALPAQRMSPDSGGTTDPGDRTASASFHDMFT